MALLKAGVRSPGATPSPSPLGLVGALSLVTALRPRVVRARLPTAPGGLALLPENFRADNYSTAETARTSRFLSRFSVARGSISSDTVCRRVQSVYPQRHAQSLTLQPSLSQVLDGKQEVETLWFRTKESEDLIAALKACVDEILADRKKSASAKKKAEVNFRCFGGCEG